MLEWRPWVKPLKSLALTEIYSLLPLTTRPPLHEAFNAEIRGFFDGTQRAFQHADCWNSNIGLSAAAV